MAAMAVAEVRETVVVPAMGPSHARSQATVGHDLVVESPERSPDRSRQNCRCLECRSPLSPRRPLGNWHFRLGSGSHRLPRCHRPSLPLVGGWPRCQFRCRHSPRRHSPRRRSRRRRSPRRRFPRRRSRHQLAEGLAQRSQFRCLRSPHRRSPRRHPPHRRPHHQLVAGWAQVLVEGLEGARLSSLGRRPRPVASPQQPAPQWR